MKQNKKKYNGVFIADAADKVLLTLENYNNPNTYISVLCIYLQILGVYYWEKAIITCLWEVLIYKIQQLLLDYLSKGTFAY